MKTLTLQIKKNWLDKILSGEKKEETREIRPKNANKYCLFDNGKLLGAIEYDNLKLVNGYSQNRPEIIIEVTKAVVELIEEETGEFMTYEENGVEYIEADVIYTLGNIIERKNC